MLLAVVPAKVPAQDRYRVTAEENFRQEPGPQSRLLARVSEGVIVRGGATRDGWIEVTLDGWIWGQSVRASPNPDFDLSVGRAAGENLRDGPNGGVLARLLAGFLLDEVERADGWVHVRRSGWMWGRSLVRQSPTTPASSPAAAPPPRAEPPAEAEGALDHMTLVPPSSLLAAPASDTVAALRAPLAARVLARADGWARVRVEGWVRETDLAPGGDSVLIGVSGAEVRSGGAAYEGRAVRWTLQHVAVRTADELRGDMPVGQRYLLARGPLPEPGFVYVLLSSAQASALEALPPLSHLAVVARVRRARSRYLGNPILELMDYAVMDR